MSPEPGERVFFHDHPSWLSMPGLYVRGVAVALLAGVIAGLASAVAFGHVHNAWVVAGVFLIFALVSVAGYTRRIRTTYTITDRRLTIDRGLFARAVREARLDHVQNVSSRQTPFERLLGVGTVDFDTAAGADYDFTFRGVSDPRAVVRIVDLILRDHDHDHDHGRNDDRGRYGDWIAELR